MDALSIKHLHKRYDDFSLQDVSFTLPSGCIMGFIGENGAGKTTTIKLILDLIHRDSGEIEVLSQSNQKNFESVKGHIGVVLDESCFPEALNALAINSIMKSIYKTWDEQRFFALCKRFSLPNQKPVKDYSRGMKMKIGIAAALSHNAKLLILDEATSGLDPIVRDEILDLLLDFIQDETHAVFLSSHILSDLEKICDYIAFIHQGKLLFCEEKDVLRDTYGIVKGSIDAISQLSESTVAKRQNAFGAEALVRRSRVPKDYAVEPASLEDIMVFMAKEAVR